MTFPTWTRRAVLAAGVALAAATAPFGATAQTPPGVLVVGQIAEPKSLDPAAVTAVNDFRILVNLYDGLVKLQTRHARGRTRRSPKAGRCPRTARNTPSPCARA
jgi:peptide/nickel transport system substrate-binding protein